jgi:hypothetical protein
VNHFAGVNDLSLAVTTPSGTQTVLVGGGGLDLEALEGTHLVVLKFEFEPVNPDRVTLYLDPTDSVEGNYTPDASILVATSDLFITHHGAITNFTFSGDTFADVTPFLTAVPAPPTFALFVAGVLGLLAARGRRAG